MSIFHKLFAGLAVVLALGVPAHGQGLVLQSTQKQTGLLELFTSEGCSSCPPAETWWSGLKQSSRLWRDFVPVAYHVDYWDSLGWPDPWATTAFSDRQRAYAQLWRNNSVYTPGFVLNAREWSRSDGAKDGPRSPVTIRGVLKVDSTDFKHWAVSFAPGPNRESRFDVHAVLLVSGVSSEVKAGENRGRRLTHDFVATACTNSSLETRNNRAEGEFNLEQGTQGSTNRLAIAVWVTRTADLEPLQAVGAWLPASAPKQ